MLILAHHAIFKLHLRKRAHAIAHKHCAASAIMCRKTLEGICTTDNLSERTLAASLRKMKDSGLIDERLFEWSDSLRIAGNEAAHGVGLSIAQPDAKDILEFTNAILDDLFSYRDRFEQFKNRRTKST